MFNPIAFAFNFLMGMKFEKKTEIYYKLISTLYQKINKYNNKTILKKSFF